MKEMSEESIEFVVGRLEKMSTGRELSQKELAELSGVGQPTISKIFSGTQRPSVDLLQKLCAEPVHDRLLSDAVDCCC